MPGQFVGVGGRAEPGHHRRRPVRGCARRFRGERSGRRVSSSVAPVCQRIPIRTLAWSGSGSRVTSAIRVRSSRLRSLLLVVGACQSPGRSAARVSSSARLGQRRQRVAGGRQRLLGFGERGEFGLPPGFEAAGDEPVLRFDGVEGAFGPVGFVAGAFDGQFGGPADAACRSVTSSAAASASATSSGFNAASSRSATASSTVDAAIDRQVGVVSRSARAEHS